MTTHKHNTDVETALRLALEALEDNQHLVVDNERHAYVMEYNDLIEKCKEALAQQEQGEPVAWIYSQGTAKTVSMNYVAGVRATPLYTTPQQRTWVGLTDDEIDEGLLRSDYALQTAHAWRAGVVFAMTKLKEKNT